MGWEKNAVLAPKAPSFSTRALRSVIMRARDLYEFAHPCDVLSLANRQQLVLPSHARFSPD